MLKQFFSLLVCVFLFGCIDATILEVRSLQEVEEVLFESSTSTLVAWDSDDTLHVAKDAILQPANHDIFRMLAYKYKQNLAPGVYEKLVSILLTKREIRLVESHTARIIHSLQHKGVPNIVLTAMHTGPCGSIPSMEEWRFNELKKLGLNFTQAYPDVPHLSFEKEFSRYENTPKFYHGILCSSEVPKGKVLVAFFHRTGWFPNKVIFFDDKFENIESVNQEMEALGIDVLACHYVVTAHVSDVVDINVAKLQVKHLNENDEWLSDGEATLIIGNQ